MAVVDAPDRFGSLPRTEAEVVAAAARLGFVVPEPCMPGVVANLALLGEHAATLLADS